MYPLAGSIQSVYTVVLILYSILLKLCDTDQKPHCAYKYSVTVLSDRGIKHLHFLFLQSSNSFHQLQSLLSLLLSLQIVIFHGCISQET